MTTITYGIKDLGGDRDALTGSAGETTEIKADGVSIKSRSGDTVSFKMLDYHIWQMDRIESETMRRTFSVSADYSGAPCSREGSRRTTACFGHEESDSKASIRRGPRGDSFSRGKQIHPKWRRWPRAR
jgi:hypothetical protein